MLKKKVSLSLAVLAGLAFSSSLLAQPWEEVFGDRSQKDEGHRRVEPVTQCPDGGYIAIGTRDLSGGLAQVYVVRTKDSGGTIWEHYYDVGADSRPDEGYALVELRDGSGFVTTGTSQRGTNWYAHAMKINCDGKVLFSYWYVINIPSLVPIRIVGHDIREAFSGDGVTTNYGDLLIAGYIDQGGRNDGFLLRLQATGGMIWNRRFDSGNNERFFGLTETRPTYAPTGDIAVVGVYDEGGPTQALVARVDGLNGDFSGSPDQCMAHYGDGKDENFQSIVEVETWPDTGLLTMAGMSSSAGMNEDVYVVQTKPNPCGMLNQVTVGNEGGYRLTEFGTDIIEVLGPVDPGLGVPNGAFALTGLATQVNTKADAFLLFLQPSSLRPITARLYGDHRGFEDFGTSLQQNSWWGPQPPGFIIAGTTFTDWDGGADPTDLYLINTTDSGKTGCETGWYPDGIRWDWRPKEMGPHIAKPFRQTEVRTSYQRDDSVVRVCQ